MRLLLLAVSVVGLVILLSACGSSSKRILDTERVERAIEQSILHKRGLHSSVSCPAGIERKKGVVFRCTAMLRNGAVTPFVVTVDSSGGAVHYVGVNR